MKKRILIADDDIAIVEAIAFLLEDAGYEAIIATSAVDITHAIEKLPDLILLDIWLSGFDGKEICLMLKKNKQTALIPVIMVSANRDTKLIAQQAHADDYIEKPFDLDVLLAKIASFLK